MTAWGNALTPPSAKQRKLYAAILELYRSGMSQRHIAARLKCSRGTVQHALRRAGGTANPGLIRKGKSKAGGTMASRPPSQPKPVDAP